MGWKKLKSKLFNRDQVIQRINKYLDVNQYFLLSLERDHYDLQYKNIEKELQRCIIMNQELSDFLLQFQEAKTVLKGSDINA